MQKRIFWQGGRNQVDCQRRGEVKSQAPGYARCRRRRRSTGQGDACGKKELEELLAGRDHDALRTEESRIEQELIRISEPLKKARSSEETARRELEQYHLIGCGSSGRRRESRSGRDCSKYSSVAYKDKVGACAFAGSCAPTIQRTVSCSELKSSIQVFRISLRSPAESLIGPSMMAHMPQ